MYDKTHKGKITVEDTLELLFVRYGRYRLDEEIYQIFGAEEKTVLILLISLTGKRNQSLSLNTMNRSNEKTSIKEKI